MLFCCKNFEFASFRFWAIRETLPTLEIGKNEIVYKIYKFCTISLSIISMPIQQDAKVRQSDRCITFLAPFFFGFLAIGHTFNL